MCSGVYRKPTGIYWDKLSKQKLAAWARLPVCLFRDV